MTLIAVYGWQRPILSAIDPGSETPTHDRQRWEKILDLLMERNVGVKLLMETRVDDIIRGEDIIWKYRDALVDRIYVGVEATSQDTLDRFNKNINPDIA